MADAFANLWDTAAPRKQSPAPQTLAAAAKSQSSSPAPYLRPQTDSFSLLVNSQASSRPTSRPLTPASSLSNASNAQIPKGPAGKPGSTQSNSGGADPFSTLLGDGLAGTSKKPSNMSIGQHRAAAQSQQTSVAGNGSATAITAGVWDGLDHIASISTPAQTASPALEDDWGLGDFGSASRTGVTKQKPSQPTTNTAKSKANDDWDFDDFTSAQPIQPQASKSSSLLDDFDDFLSSKPAPAASSSRPRSHNQSRTDTPANDFDFGDREYTAGLLGDESDSGGEDDLLGALGKPARPKPANHDALEVDTSSTGPSKQRSSPRPVSPPPHLIGQIVEMGFTPQQARVALAATDTGLDVQMALETLLQGGDVEHVDDDDDDGLPTNNGGRRFNYDSDDEPQPPKGRARGAERQKDTSPQPPPSRRQQQRPQPQQQRPESSRSVGSSDLQERADKLLAQASGFGLSMLKSANAVWKEGKEKVAKAYVEHAAGLATGTGPVSGRSSKASNSSGRPKWMTEGIDDDDGHHAGSSHGGFRDDDDVREETQKRPPPRRADSSGGSSRAPPQAQPAPEPRKPFSLFDTDGDTPTYASPARRRAPNKQNTASTSSTTLPSRPSPAASPAPAPPLRRRPSIAVSDSERQMSEKHKQTGTEMFKLGRYADADQAYSRALEALPSQHLLRIPLLNNRALSRLKTGDYNGVVQDCTTVIELVGLPFEPTLEVPHKEVDLGAGVVKALQRRAKAYEGKERWSDAAADWDKVIACQWATAGKKEALDGVGRCRRMASANSQEASGSTPAAPPKPKSAPPKAKLRPKPPVARSAIPSAAVDSLRKANATIEAEENEKDALKDSIDSRLQQWKGGKENNVRALIASLDTLLWPELGWTKVGMHELVSPGQVKVRYMKAIAKLHPDKLNTSNTTVEQRMIANGVFAALNDAWLVFKQ